MVRVAAVLAESKQVPLFESVIVAVSEEVVSDAEQPEKPVGSVTVAPDEGWENPEGSVTEIVLPAASAPEDEVVKPIVQVDDAPVASEPGVKVTEVAAV